MEATNQALDREIKEKKNTSEIHISGRIDNFLFGKIKDPYFDEIKKSKDVFKDNQKNNQLFLEKFFSLFLENNHFSNKTNLELFEDIVDTTKLFQFCPNFYKIYSTILPENHTNKEIVIKENETYLRTEEIRSNKYDYYSFLEEIIDSPSHLSENNNPNICNQFRVFSPELYIEVFDQGKKIHEGELGKFLELKDIRDLVMDDKYQFSDKQKKVFDKFKENKLSYFDITPVATTKHQCIQYDGFWPLDYFKFLMGDSPELFDEQTQLYQVANKHFQYFNEKEVRVTFSNVSKCVFKIEDKIDFEKLLLLRCGLDEVCRTVAINYNDDTNIFNFLAYDGKLLKPNEIIFRDKGISIDFSGAMSYGVASEEKIQQTFFYELFID